MCHLETQFQSCVTSSLRFVYSPFLAGYKTIANKELMVVCVIECTRQDKQATSDNALAF